MATVIDRLTQAEQTVDKLTDLIGAILPQVAAGKALFDVIKRIAGEVGVNVGTFEDEIGNFDEALAKGEAVLAEYRAQRNQDRGVVTPVPPA